MRRRWRVVLATLLGLTLALLWGARFFGEDIARTILLREIRRAVPGSMTAGSLSIALVPPSVALRDVAIRDEEGMLVASAVGISIDLAAWVSLWEGVWIADIVVDEPRIVYRESSSFWVRVEESAGEAVEGEPSFLPRSFEVRSGRLDVDLVELDATIEQVSVRAETHGILNPRLRFFMDARGRIERLGKRLDLTQISLGGSTAGEDVQIERLLIDGGFGRLEGQAVMEPPRLRGEVRWDVRLSPLFSLLPEAGIVEGDGRITAKFDGTIESPEFDARLVAREVRIDDVAFSGTGMLRSDGARWHLSEARAEMFGGTVEGEATGRMAAHVPYELRGKFRGWDPATFVALFGAILPLQGHWEGEARLAGLLLGDDVEGEGRFTLVEGEHRLDGEVSFAVTEPKAEVKGTIEAATRGRLECRYAVDEGNVDGTVRLGGRDLSFLAPFLGARFGGRGEIDGRFRGTSSEPVLEGMAALEEVNVRGESLGGVRGPYVVSSGGVRTTGFRLFDDRLELVGDVALTAEDENAWSATARDLPLPMASAVARAFRPELPPLLGRVDGAAEARGRWPSGDLRTRFEVVGLGFGAVSVGDVRGSASRLAEAWAVEATLAGEEGAEGRIEAAASADGALSGRLRVEGAALQTIPGVRQRWPDLEGRVAATAELSGTLEHPRADAEIGVRAIALRGQRLGDVHSTLTLRDRNMALEVAAEDVWRLRLTSILQHPYPFELRLDWDGADLPVSVLQGSQVLVSTRGSGTLRGDGEEPLGRGALQLERLEIRRQEIDVAIFAPVTVRISEGVVEIPPTELRGENERLVVRGRLSDAESELSAEGTANLALLETVSPSVASARGALRFHLEAGRRGADDWRYDGAAEVRNGALDLGFLVGITELAGEVDFDGRVARLREVTGRLGGGGFLVEGDVAFDEGWNVGWAFRDANLGVPEWLDYRAAGNGRVTGRIAHPMVTGEIEFQQAVYDRRIEWAEFLPWFRREARPSRGDAGLPVDLDLHVFADGGLYVDNNLVEAELQANVNLQVKGRTVEAAGRIDVLSGEFTFRRRTFTLTSGSVQFLEARPLNPDLEFHGETTVTTVDGDYEIAVHVGGTAESPRVEFTADDPALTENDVLALVTFGRTVTQLQAQGAGIELTEVLALTTGPRAGDVEERIYGFLPVDQIEIQPTFSRTTGASEPRLSIGKELTERFRAVLGTGLGSERQQDVTLEYQLTPRISVLGIWESQTKSQAGAFGGDIKFRYPFRTFAQFKLFPFLRDGER